ncbi:MAG: hypothetical protein ACRCV9_11950 [Burkholderiaceae bacterium]
MKKSAFALLVTAALASSNVSAQSNAADAPVISETAIVMLHAVRADCAAQFPALKTKLDESFGKLRAQHQAAFNTAEGSTDFDARVDRTRSSIEARKDRARYEAVCAKLAESEQNWR